MKYLSVSETSSAYKGKRVNENLVLFIFFANWFKNKFYFLIVLASWLIIFTYYNPIESTVIFSVFVVRTKIGFINIR